VERIVNFFLVGIGWRKKIKKIEGLFDRVPIIIILNDPFDTRGVFVT